jgi:hypothetical protein
VSEAKRQQLQRLLQAEPDGPWRPVLLLAAIRAQELR